MEMDRQYDDTISLLLPVSGADVLFRNLGTESLQVKTQLQLLNV